MRVMKDSGVEWIGEIPEGWEVRPLKSLGDYRNGLTYAPENIVTEGNGTLVLRSSNIQNGKISLEDNVFVNQQIPEQLRVKAGDILICSRNGSRDLIGKNAIVPIDINASFGAFMMIFRSKFPQYMYYILNSTIFNYYLGMFLTATINQLTGKNFGNMETVFCTDSVERQRIVNYLDEQCGEIDKVLEKTRESIEEYKKLKQSVITEAVTKGIRPNRPMKPSGIEWIGDIPAEWGITSIGRMCFVTKLAGFEFTNDMMANISDMGEVPIVRAQNIKMGKFLNKISEFIPLSLSLKLARCALDKKSLLITFIGAGIGEVAIFDEPQRYHLAPNVAKIEVNKDMKKFISEEFLLYFLMSSAGQEEVNKIKKATAQPSLSMETIRSMKCIVPLTLVEQQEIVNHLDQQCAEIDNLITKKEQIITELESYKKSLIYECVTGKREVAG